MAGKDKGHKEVKKPKKDAKKLTSLAKILDEPATEVGSVPTRRRKPQEEQ